MGVWVRRACVRADVGFREIHGPSRGMGRVRAGGLGMQTLVRVGDGEVRVRMYRGDWGYGLSRMSDLGWRLAGGGGASESQGGQGGGFYLAEEPL